MYKRYLFFTVLLLTVALIANAELTSRDNLGALQQMTIGNEGNPFISKIPQAEREIPLPGIHSVQSGIDYGDGGTNTPVAYQEARHIVINPYTLYDTEGNLTPATWVIWETGANDDREVYAKYYHSFFSFWDGPYQVSETVNDAGRPAMCVTDNGWMHCVYHGDHDATGAYEIAYSKHPGMEFNPWTWQEVISTNDDEGLFPTIVADGNDVWVAYERFWEAPNQELDLQHGVWDDATETMIWWSAEDIKLITVSTAGWFFGSMDICPEGMVHIAYGNSDDDLTYRAFDPVADDFIAEEEVLDESPEDGPIYSPSLVVDSQGEVHIVYPYSFYGGEAGNLGTVNYIHGNAENWSEREFLHYWQDTAIVDSFSTYPVISIDPYGGLWVTYTNLRGVDEPGTGYYQLVELYKPYNHDWQTYWLTKPDDGEGGDIPDDLPGWFVYNEVPNYPSITHKIPVGVDRPNICFAEYDEATEISTVYVVTGDYPSG